MYLTTRDALIFVDMLNIFVLLRKFRYWQEMSSFDSVKFEPDSIEYYRFLLNLADLNISELLLYLVFGYENTWNLKTDNIT